MLALTKKTDYAIIALAYMAQRQASGSKLPGAEARSSRAKAGDLCSAREISERFHMPLPLLMNVLKSLCHGELVRSTRGVKGGYSLAMRPEQITLDEIIRVVEGPVRFVQCAPAEKPGQSGCDLLPSCPVTRPIRKIHEKLRDFLNNVTLAHIAYDEEYGVAGEGPHVGSLAGVQCIPLSHEGTAMKKMER